MMTVNRYFAMNVRHGTSIMHMHVDPRHGPLFDKSDPLINLLAVALVYKRVFCMIMINW